MFYELLGLFSRTEPRQSDEFASPFVSKAKAGWIEIVATKIKTFGLHHRSNNFILLYCNKFFFLVKQESLLSPLLSNLIRTLVLFQQKLY